MRAGYLFGFLNLNLACLAPLPLAGLVPLGVFTVTYTVPVPPGDSTVTDVAETVLMVPEVEPNMTVSAPVKLVPATVTSVPPAVDPVFGDRAVTVGGGLVGTYTKDSELLLPPAVSTVTNTVPVPAGDVAEHSVSIQVALTGDPPNLTSVTPDRFVPLTCTGVPPDALPAPGSMLVRVGAGTTV